MKAIIQTGYGPVERVWQQRDMPQPKPKANEVLVRVKATSVHADVWHVAMGLPKVLRIMGNGVFKPRQPIPGIDVAGDVVAVGESVTQFNVGDAVFGESHKGMQWKTGGAFAEYVAAPASSLVHKPEPLSYEQAAAIATPGIIAWQNLHAGALLENAQRVLVNGAAGALGSLVVQMAKAYGAHVTAVDRRATFAYLTELGADDCVDFERENIMSRSPSAFDLVVDVASTLPIPECQHLMAEQGQFVLIGHDHFGKQGGRWLGSIPAMFKPMLDKRFKKHLPKGGPSSLSKHECLNALRALAVEGKLSVRIVERYPLSEAVTAMQQLQTGAAVGRIVLMP
ncbi:NAD(P)-dependent alcohol dehydrogenase [Salinispirillum marinum]|uniref:NAD(P)-dependent alcohol dehydrogenase n=2 Tax=Saccharospirillaceae TaxID=255527 RepID=A0ABV8BE05_9GAMM